MPARETGFNTYKLRFTGDIRYEYNSWGDSVEERWQVEKEILSFGKDVASALSRAENFYLSNIKNTSQKIIKDLRFENVNLLEATLVYDGVIAFPEMGYQGSL